MSALQAGTAVGSPLAYVGTFLLAAAFYTLTAHVAARWVLGETPLRRAVGVGVGPAAVTLALDPFGPGIVVPLAILVDVAAIELAYDEGLRTTGMLAVVHVAVSVALGIAIVNLTRLVV